MVNVNFYVILEVVFEEKLVLFFVYGCQFCQVVELVKGMFNLYRESSVFDYFLEVVSGVSGDGEEEGVFSG